MGQHDDRVRMFLTGFGQFFTGGISRAVIDTDNLEIDALESGMHLVDHGMNIARLIEEGDQHGKGRSACHTPPD
jgi:hypothetical protein